MQDTLLLNIDESALFSRLLHLLPPKGSFIEVGCRDGNDHLKHLAANGWSGHCIEANPEIYPNLAKNYSGNTRIKCHNLAITDSDGDVSFFIESTPNSGVSSIYKDRANASDALNVSRVIKKTERVKSRTLNSFASLESINNLDLLMTDCEGADVSILLSTDFSIFRPSYIFSETATLFYTHPDFKGEDRRQISFEVYEKLISYMDKWDYDLILSNDLLSYKESYYPDLKGVPMNCVFKSKS